MNWTVTVIKSLQEIQWTQIGVERELNSASTTNTTTTTKPLYSMVNPNAIVNDIITQYSANVYSSFMTMLNDPNGSNKRLLTLLRSQNHVQDTHSFSTQPILSTADKSLPSSASQASLVSTNTRTTRRTAAQKRALEAKSSTNAFASSRVNDSDNNADVILQPPAKKTNNDISFEEVSKNLSLYFILFRDVFVFLCHLFLFFNF